MWLKKFRRQVVGTEWVNSVPDNAPSGRNNFTGAPSTPPGLGDMDDTDHKSEENNLVHWTHCSSLQFSPQTEHASVRRSSVVSCSNSAFQCSGRHGEFLHHSYGIGVRFHVPCVPSDVGPARWCNLLFELRSPSKSVVAAPSRHTTARLQQQQPVFSLEVGCRQDRTRWLMRMIRAPSVLSLCAASRSANPSGNNFAWRMTSFSVKALDGGSQGRALILEAPTNVDFLSTAPVTTVTTLARVNQHLVPYVVVVRIANLQSCWFASNAMITDEPEANHFWVPWLLWWWQFDAT